MFVRGAFLDNATLFVTNVWYRIVLYAVPYSTQYRIVGRYVRILINIDQILTKKHNK